MPRFYCPAALVRGELLELPAAAARHVQVLRLQPGQHITLFNRTADDRNGGAAAQSAAGEFDATITAMGRNTVQVQVGAYQACDREAPRQVHLVLGMPVNERMDWLIEKSTELGVISIQPLMTERSVMRLVGERGEKKLVHWQSIAVAACEQCGGNRLPLIHPVLNFADWLQRRKDFGDSADAADFVLSLRAGTPGPRQALAILEQRFARVAASVTFLSGPEGGLSRAEEDAATRCGFVPVSLGQRVLRAETAALCALTALLVN